MSQSFFRHIPPYALPLLLLVTTAQASELEVCLSSPSSNENGCYAEEMTRQEKTLETAFRQKLRSITYDKAAMEEGWSKQQFSEMRKQLSLSQAEWKKYTEAWCRYQAETMNGTGSPAVYTQCKAQMINARLKQISE